MWKDFQRSGFFYLQIIKWLTQVFFEMSFLARNVLQQNLVRVNKIDAQCGEAESQILLDNGIN